MKKRFVLPLVAGLAGLSTANAAVVVANFGATATGANVNNYGTPDPATYNGGGGTFTTSTSGTTAGSGINHNTAQTFKDTTGVDTGLTLGITRTAAKVFNQTITPAYNNTAAVAAISADTGVATADLNSTLAGFISSGAGGSRISSFSLNNLHDGSSALGYTITFYAGVSALDGTLTSFAINGGTQNSIAYAGQDGTGFDQSTLAGSGPGGREMTLVKWTGSLTSAQNRLTVELNGGKSGVGMFAYKIDAIPEPSSTALLGLGGLALVLRRRK